MHIDHVVLWVGDVERSLAFYVDVLGCDALRLEEFREGTAPFVSVRISGDSILDLMRKETAPFVRQVTGESAPTAAGEPVNHVCLSMSPEALEALRRRLEEAGVRMTSTASASFGARGYTDMWFYFQDPDGNVLEARAYA